MTGPLVGQLHSKAGPAPKSSWAMQTELLSGVKKKKEENSQWGGKGGEGGQETWEELGMNMIKIQCIKFS